MEALSPRASSLLKTLVEMHIREGQPIASKNLQGESGLSVSSATVRNIMSELEDLGYLASPHTSAGRVPTPQGYRFFVDSLLQVGPVEEDAVSVLNAGLDPNRSSSELVQSASNLLAQITYQTGIDRSKACCKSVTANRVLAALGRSRVGDSGHQRAGGTKPHCSNAPANDRGATEVGG